MQKMKRASLFCWNIIVKLAYGVLSVLYKIFGKKLTEDAFEKWLQFIKFGIVGTFNTVLNYIITLYGCLALRQIIANETTALQISNTTGFIITVFISYLLNGAFVFKVDEGQRRNPWKTLLKTYAAYSVTGFFLNNILIFFEIRLLHISVVIAPLINVIIDVPVNFFVNKLWAYKAE